MTHLNDIHSPVNGHILVAEDDCIVQMVVKEMLERVGLIGFEKKNVAFARFISRKHQTQRSVGG